jgi:hypothetical protein
LYQLLEATRADAAEGENTKLAGCLGVVADTRSDAADV